METRGGLTRLDTEHQAFDLLELHQEVTQLEYDEDGRHCEDYAIFVARPGHILDGYTCRPVAGGLRITLDTSKRGL